MASGPAAGPTLSGCVSPTYAADQPPIRVWVIGVHSSCVWISCVYIRRIYMCVVLLDVREATYICAHFSPLERA